MTAQITTTRVMRGSNFTIEDYENLFAGAPKNCGVDVDKSESDRFSAPMTTVTVTIPPKSRGAAYTSDYVSGTGSNTTQDDSDPYGPREATR